MDRTESHDEVAARNGDDLSSGQACRKDLERPCIAWYVEDRNQRHVVFFPGSRNGSFDDPFDGKSGRPGPRADIHGCGNHRP